MSVDYDPATNPMGKHGNLDLALAGVGITRPGLRQIWRRFHAFEHQDVSKRQSQLDPNMSVMDENEDYLLSLAIKYKNPGSYLHYTQDRFAHGGWMDIYGHGPGGHLTDYFATNPEMAANMTRDTIEKLLNFSRAVCEQAPKHDICLRVRRPKAENMARLNKVLWRMIAAQPNQACGLFGKDAKGTYRKTRNGRGEWTNCHIKDVRGLKKEIQAYVATLDESTVYRGKDYEALQERIEQTINRISSEPFVTNHQIEFVALVGEALSIVETSVGRSLEVQDIYYKYTYEDMIAKNENEGSLLDSFVKGYISKEFDVTLGPTGVPLFDYLKLADDMPLGNYLGVIQTAVKEDKQSGLLPYLFRETGDKKDRLKNRQKHLKDIETRLTPELSEKWMRYRFELDGSYKHGGPPVALENRSLSLGLTSETIDYEVVRGKGKEAIYKVTLDIPVRLSGSQNIHLARTYLNGSLVDGVEMLRQLPIVIQTYSGDQAPRGYPRDPEDGIVYVWDADEYEPVIDSKPENKAGRAVPHLTPDGQHIRMVLYRTGEQLADDNMSWQIEAFPYSFGRPRSVTYEISVEIEDEVPEIEVADTTTSSGPLGRFCPMPETSGTADFNRKSLHLTQGGVPFTPDGYLASHPDYLTGEYYGYLYKVEIEKGGQKSGLSIAFDENGWVNEFVPYGPNDNTHGVEVIFQNYYGTKGTVESVKTYINDERNGLYVSYGDSGNLSSQGTYIDDKLDGLNYDGLNTVRYYENGEQLSRAYTNDKGETQCYASGSRCNCGSCFRQRQKLDPRFVSLSTAYIDLQTQIADLDKKVRDVSLSDAQRQAFNDQRWDLIVRLYEDIVYQFNNKKPDPSLFNPYSGSGR